MFTDRRDKLGINATVLDCERGEPPCRLCGERRLNYQAHFFREGRIVAACKPCLIALVGGEVKIHVRRIPELRGLPALWQRDARGAAPAHLAAARQNARQSSRMEILAAPPLTSGPMSRPVSVGP